MYIKIICAIKLIGLLNAVIKNQHKKLRKWNILSKCSLINNIVIHLKCRRYKYIKLQLILGSV